MFGDTFGYHDGENLTSFKLAQVKLLLIYKKKRTDPGDQWLPLPKIMLISARQFSEKAAGV